MDFFNRIAYQISGMPWPLLVALGVALIITILICALVFPKRRDEEMSGFTRFLKDFFEVRYLLIEKIIKFFYVLFTFTLIFGGIVMIFTYEPFWVGIVVMILGPIALRFVHELLMLAILLVKNTMEINNKLPDGRKLPKRPPMYNDIVGGPSPMFDSNMPQPNFGLNMAQQGFAPNAPQPDNTANAAPFVPAGGVKVCANCGAVVSGDSDFCPECGNRII